MTKKVPLMMVHKPSMQPSDEATGQAYQQALEYMARQVVHGSKKPGGEYLVGYAIEEAEGLYHLQDGRLE